MEKKTKAASRRNFLFGLAAGAGVASLVAAAPRGAAAKAAPKSGEPVKETLFRRGEEAERYYKTLYS